MRMRNRPLPNLQLVLPPATYDLPWFHTEANASGSPGDSFLPPLRGWKSLRRG